MLLVALFSFICSASVYLISVVRVFSIGQLDVSSICKCVSSVLEHCIRKLKKIMRWPNVFNLLLKLWLNAKQEQECTINIQLLIFFLFTGQQRGQVFLNIGSNQIKLLLWLLRVDSGDALVHQAPSGPCPSLRDVGRCQSCCVNIKMDSITQIKKPKHLDDPWWQAAVQLVKLDPPPPSQSKNSKCKSNKHFPMISVVFGGSHHVDATSSVHFTN